MRWGRRMRPALRAVALGLVLVVTAAVVPDSAHRPGDLSVVRMRQADGVDASSRVVWILGVGSDARPGQDMRRARGDALQLVGIHPRTGAATAIGIPRDSWVSLPGRGRQKINAALSFGGPQGMGQAVARLVGVRPDYVVVTRFPFFENLVDDIGGITVRNPRAFSDPNLRPRGFRAGRLRLDGYAAMGFARIRKSLPGGDVARSANQQRVLRGIRAAVAARADRPGFVERAVVSVMRNTATDLSPVEMFRLAQAVAHVDGRRISSCVVGGRIGSAGGQSVVFPNVAQARRYGDDARRDATIRRC
jgi:LCP family protein required for cell wall assembly